MQDAKEIKRKVLTSRIKTYTEASWRAAAEARTLLGVSCPDYVRAGQLLDASVSFRLEANRLFEERCNIR